MEQNRRLVLPAYIGVYIIWGTTYFLISLSVETLSPAWVVAIRFLVAGLSLLILSLANGQVKKLPTLAELSSSLFLGLFLLILGNGLVTIAEQKVDSYLAALILAAQPVNMAIMSFILHRKLPGPIPFLGMLTGMIGVGLLLWTGGDGGFEISLSLILVLASLIFFGFGTVAGSRMTSHPSLFFGTSIQMLFAGSVALIVALMEPHSLESLAGVSWKSGMALGALILLGTLGILAYNYLIPREPAHRLSTYAFVNPLIAVLLGLFLGGEHPVPLLIPGLLTILFSLVLVLYGDRFRNHLKKSRLSRE